MKEFSMNRKVSNEEIGVRLTPMEKQIVDVTNNSDFPKTIQEIAKKMSITPATVAGYKHRLQKKGVSLALRKPMNISQRIIYETLLNGPQSYQELMDKLLIDEIAARKYVAQIRNNNIDIPIKYNTERKYSIKKRNN